MTAWQCLVTRFSRRGGRPNAVSQRLIGPLLTFGICTLQPYVVMGKQGRPNGPRQSVQSPASSKQRASWLHSGLFYRFDAMQGRVWQGLSLGWDGTSLYSCFATPSSYNNGLWLWEKQAFLKSYDSVLLLSTRGGLQMFCFNSFYCSNYGGLLPYYRLGEDCDYCSYHRYSHSSATPVLSAMLGWNEHLSAVWLSLCCGFPPLLVCPVYSVPMVEPSPPSQAVHQSFFLSWRHGKLPRGQRGIYRYNSCRRLIPTAELSKTACDTRCTAEHKDFHS